MRNILLFAIFIGMSVNLKSQNSNRMQSQGKMTLTYIKGMAPVSYEPENKVGEILGSGRGVISGIVSGKVHWTISEVVGNTCETSIYGSIITETNDVVHFETKGFGTRLNPDKDPQTWHMPAVIILKANAESAPTLSNKVFFLKGTFDMGAGIHSYELFSSE